VVEPQPTLQLDVVAPDADPEELAELSARLRRELLQLDVASVEQPRSDAPAGAKGADAAQIGTMLVTLAEAGVSLATLVTAVRSWLGGSPDRKVRLELDGDAIELTGVTSDERQRLLDAWLERHAEAR
jgi:hypothetical protein